MPLDFTRMSELLDELRAVVYAARKPVIVCAQKSGVQCGGCADDMPLVQAAFGGVRLPSVPEPRNNDGRRHCWWCWSWTEKRQGFTAEYDVCPKCGK